MRWPDAVERSVHAAIESARAGSTSILDITGHAGFGKTSLARWVARQFPDDQVLRATAYGGDQADSLGVLRQLDPDLPGGDTNPLRVARRIGRRIDELQVSGTVVLLVDDLQWADPESVEALGVLVERMAGDRVLIVTSHRPGGARSLQWDARVDAAAAVFRLRLDGLDDESTLQLIREGWPDTPLALARHLRRHTGGSPLLLRSLLQEYSPQVLQVLADRERLPAPSDVIAVMNDRLSQLDPDVVAVLEALAVLGDVGADTLVVAAVADVADIDHALAALESERLVVTEGGPLARVRIFHGVLRAAIYANIPAPARRRLHGRAAARLASPGDRLKHRVAAARTTDDGLAADLDALADELHTARQYRGAARTRRQAAFLSSASEARIRRERDADFEAILALDLDDVMTVGGAADSDPRTRFTLGARLVAEHRYVAAADLLESLTPDELVSLGDLTAYRARVLRGWAIISAGRSPDRALDDLRSAAGSRAQDPALQGYFAIAHGQAASLAEPVAAVPRFQKMLLAQRSQLATTPAGLTQLAWRGTSLSLNGIQRMAVADLDVVLSRMGEGIVDFGDGVFHAFQGLAYFLDGQWGRASISFDLARTEQTTIPAPITMTLLPLTAVMSGHAAAAQEALEAGRRIRVHSPQPAAVNAADLVEVFAMAFLGSPTQRAQWLGRRTADFGDPLMQLDGPGVPLICHVTQSIAASWADRPDAARDWAQRLRALPLAPWTDRVADWLDARIDDDDNFVERIEPLSRSGLPDIPALEILIHLDLVRRTSGAVQQAAQRRLERALDDFGGDRLRTALFAAEGTEQIAVKASPTTVFASLSDREREIATLLLEGLSYAQIGRELFITRSTVSFHLTRIYAKTGTTSRHELAQITHERGHPPGLDVENGR